MPFAIAMHTLNFYSIHKMFIFHDNKAFTAFCTKIESVEPLHHGYEYSYVMHIKSFENFQLWNST